MLRRLVDEEAGMTMGLAVIMLVLIGIMGAGLLTFVQRDLKAVVEVNQGQKALDIAEAGVQAARAQLRVDSVRQHYDRSSANDCTAGKRVGNADWSPSTASYSNAINCTGAITRTADAVGVTRNFAGGRFRVTIECYRQTADPLPSPCTSGPTPSPEPLAEASDKKFFRVVSTGYDRASGDGAVRRVEAIIVSTRLTSFPSAYFTPKSIRFNGNVTLRGVSFFAGGNIEGVNQGSFSANRNATALYGNWNRSPYNTVSRTRSGVGFGALGLVCGNQCSSDSDSLADGNIDFDRTTGTKGLRKVFTYKKDASGQPAPTRALNSNEISFPFDPGNVDNPSAVVDPALVGDLENIARGQATYCDSATCSTLTTWPGSGSVYFVDGQDATFKVNQTPVANGIIVVRNGNFTLNNASNGFRGIILVLGNGTTTGNYTSMGGTSLDGYAIASGGMELGGNIEPDSTFDYSALFVLTEISTWSWRERYD